MSTNRYEAEQETKERSHNNAVRELAQSRHETKEFLTHAEVEGAPPYQTIINPDPPTPGQINGRSRWQPPRWADAVRGLHAATLEYWTEVKPYRSRVMNKWEDPVAKIPHPRPGEWETQYQRFNQEFDQRGVDYSTAEITLKELGQNWRFQNIVLACRHDEGVTTRQEKIYLPPVACRAIYEELNDILEELGLSAEVREIEAHATDPGVPDDIDDWGIEDDA